jgi:hypothetical protein
MQSCLGIHIRTVAHLQSSLGSSRKGRRLSTISIVPSCSSLTSKLAHVIAWREIGTYYFKSQAFRRPVGDPGASMVTYRDVAMSHLLSHRIACQETDLSPGTGGLYADRPKSEAYYSRPRSQLSHGALDFQGGSMVLGCWEGVSP